jgi:hypothetical protein
MSLDNLNLSDIFNQQVNTLLKKNYPKLAGMTETEFTGLLYPLQDLVSSLRVNAADIPVGYLPFVIVVKSEVVPCGKAMAAIEKDGFAGIVKLNPLTPDEFHVKEDITIPEKPVYLLADIDRGRKYLNVTPHDAMEQIIRDHRTPLTIDEGIAVVTQYPEYLMKNNCFSLLASRHTGDKRVPAIWINGNKQPNLGWCWENNPHTWLGSISAESRIG